MGILSSGIALGGVLGLLLGGHLEGVYGWRVAFMTVGVPGFIMALLVSRLVDPTRAPSRLTVRSFLRDFEIGVLPLLRNLWPLLAGVAVGGAAAYRLDRSYGADSKIDLAVFSGAVGLGVARHDRALGAAHATPATTSRRSAAGSAGHSTTSCARSGSCCTPRRWSTCSRRAP